MLQLNRNAKANKLTLLRRYLLECSFITVAQNKMEQSNIL